MINRIKKGLLKLDWLFFSRIVSHFHKMHGGETNLGSVLRTLEPHLKDPVYVFISIPSENLALAFNELNPVSTIFEDEGLSLIVTKEAAVAWNIKNPKAGMCNTFKF